MDKVKIQEIADEAGLSNGDLLDKAKELGFDVKAANSTISMENAGILVDYAISGTLPKGFNKPGSKAKITVVKKKVEVIEKKVLTPEVETAATEEPAAETVAETPEVTKEETVEAVTPEVTEEVVEEVVEKPVVKEVKKRKGISVVRKQNPKRLLLQKMQINQREKHFLVAELKSLEKRSRHL